MLCSMKVCLCLFSADICCMLQLHSTEVSSSKLLNSTANSSSVAAAYNNYQLSTNRSRLSYNTTNCSSVEKVQKNYFFFWYAEASAHWSLHLISCTECQSAHRNVSLLPPALSLLILRNPHCLFCALHISTH